jgi:formamidopyrimidine-DNA glycosylase
MPEITEIILTSQYVLAQIKNHLITKITILGGRYSKSDDGIEGLDDISDKFPLIVTDINSKGKFMWFITKPKKNLQDTVFILNTFGLSGEWGFTKEDHSNIEFNIQNPNTNQIRYLYYTDPRNFGTIKITSSLTELDKKLKSMGPDLLKTPFTEDDFYERVAKFIHRSKNNKNVLIVKVLMDQTKNALGSGLGNYLVPEILYRAKISPRRKIGELSVNDIHVLSQTIKYVLKLSYMHNKTGYMTGFGNWIDQHYTMVENGELPNYYPDIVIDKTTKFDFYVYRKKTDPNGNKVVPDIIINNRTTYWVPTVQL